MAEDKSRPGLDIFSVEDMRGWLKEEIRDVDKARQLRIKDAQNLVDAYAAGKITPEEATSAMADHDRRWGESLSGTSAFPGMSDADILKEIDIARDERYGQHTGRILDKLNEDKKLTR